MSGAASEFPVPAYGKKVGVRRLQDFIRNGDDDAGLVAPIGAGDDRPGRSPLPSPREREEGAQPARN